MRICVECRHHHRIGRREGEELCKHPEVQKVNIVTGKPIHITCSFSRTEKGKCGPQGKLWKGNGGVCYD